MASGEPKVTLAGHRDAVAGLAFRPDGKVLATASDDRTVRLWDVVGPKPDPVPRAGIPWVTEPPIKEPTVFDRVGDFVSAVAWSPDGRWLAVRLWDQTVQVWDAATGDVRHTLAGHTARVSSLAFTPDSARLVSAALEPVVRTSAVTDGKPGPTLVGHAGAVFAVGVGPDGTRVVTAGHDRTVRVWDAASGSPVRVAATHGGAGPGGRLRPGRRQGAERRGGRGGEPQPGDHDVGRGGPAGQPPRRRPRRPAGVGRGGQPGRPVSGRWRG